MLGWLILNVIGKMLKSMKKILYLLLSFIVLYACTDKSDSVGPGESSSGKGGATARFTIAKNYLYIVDNQSLKVYNIATAENPIFIKKVSLRTVVETIFPFKDHLLVGTQTGMYIFSISDPENPVSVSVYNHVVSCDPVVADGDYAYVTLRRGTGCNRGIDALDIIDIKNLSSPKLIKSYPMQNPHGLGVDGRLLFVTEGDYGLKVFDRSNPNEIKEIANFKDFSAYDVIPDSNTLIVTGRDGVYQYSYGSENELKLLSKIAIEP